MNFLIILFGLFIIVMAGHEESGTDADLFDVDVAGVTILGLGPTGDATLRRRLVHPDSENFEPILYFFPAESVGYVQRFDDRVRELESLVGSYEGERRALPAPRPHVLHFEDGE